jgi:hypothetical protein
MIQAPAGASLPQVTNVETNPETDQRDRIAKVAVRDLPVANEK